MSSADPLAITACDEKRSKHLDETSALIILGIARILSETEWHRLAPDELIELIEILSFNAGETLAILDDCHECG